MLHDLREVATRERTEGTTRRRPGDAARVAVAALLLVPLIIHAHHPTATEEAVVRLFESIPPGAKTLFLILYQLAALWAVALLVVTVLLLRRWRLARDLAVAAAAAWVLGRLMAFLVHDEGLWQAFKVTFDLTGAPRFPMVRLSVAVATVLVASPHLARPTRRFGQGLVVLLALSSLYLSRGFPTDLIAAIVLGWGVAHLVEWIFGTPVGRPARSQVEEALTKVGVPVHDLHPRRSNRSDARSSSPSAPTAAVPCAWSPSVATRPTPSTSRARGATSRTATRRRRCSRVGAHRWSTRPT
jgi:undecaprenyl-diphosphatase